jgi:hypothetical protein
VFAGLDTCVAEETSWTKALADRSQRGTLHDAALIVRGDSGRWMDEETFVHAPPPAKANSRWALDDWVDAWSEKKYDSTAADDNWLILRTKQLNDNDRLWVERVERSGNKLKVVVTLASWRGKYQKNFTLYHVFGVNVGKLAPGEYEATCVILPAAFTKFDGSGRPVENTPEGRQKENAALDDAPTDAKPLERTLKFTVGK